MTTSDNPITRGFEALKQRAKELVRAARAGDPAAIGRLRSVPRLSQCDDAALAKAAAACSAACRPIDDKRGTIAYRTKVAGVLLKRTTAIAAERAKGK